MAGFDGFHRDRTVTLTAAAFLASTINGVYDEAEDHSHVNQYFPEVLAETPSRNGYHSHVNQYFPEVLAETPSLNGCHSHVNQYFPEVLAETPSRNGCHPRLDQYILGQIDEFPIHHGRLSHWNHQSSLGLIDELPSHTKYQSYVNQYFPEVLAETLSRNGCHPRFDQYILGQYSQYIHGRLSHWNESSLGLIDELPSHTKYQPRLAQYILGETYELPSHHRSQSQSNQFSPWLIDELRSHTRHQSCLRTNALEMDVKLRKPCGYQDDLEVVDALPNRFGQRSDRGIASSIGIGTPLLIIFSVITVVCLLYLRMQ